MTVPLVFHLESLPGGSTLRLVAESDGAPAGCRGFLEALRDDGPSSRAAFARTLAAAPFEAFAWECGALFADDLDAPLEMVVVDSPALARRAADPEPFRAHFEAAAGEVATFENLGGDAVLVVPCPRAETSAYPHLARFVRAAPEAQVQAHLRATAEATLARLAGRVEPLFLSTAGLGVSWLHVRLDDRPKYYRHAQFRSAARTASQRRRD